MQAASSSGFASGVHTRRPQTLRHGGKGSCLVNVNNGVNVLLSQLVDDLEKVLEITRVVQVPHTLIGFPNEQAPNHVDSESLQICQRQDSCRHSMNGIRGSPAQAAQSWQLAGAVVYSCFQQFVGFQRGQAPKKTRKVVSTGQAPKPQIDGSAIYVASAVHISFHHTPP